MVNMMKRIKGIGLLELMLSLTIIAVLLIMATRYYNQTQIQARVNRAVQTFQAVYAGCETLINDDPGTDCKLNTMTDAGYLPITFKKADGADTSTENPWGGNLTSDYTGSPKRVEISMTNVPTADCNILVNRLRQTLVTSNSAILSPGEGQSNTACGTTTKGDPNANTVTVAY